MIKMNGNCRARQRLHAYAHTRVHTRERVHAQTFFVFLCFLCVHVGDNR